MINILIFIVLAAVIAILSTRTKAKGIIAVCTVIIVGLVTGFAGIRALLGYNYENSVIRNRNFRRCTNIS